MGWRQGELLRIRDVIISPDLKHQQIMRTDCANHHINALASVNLPSITHKIRQVRLTQVRSKKSSFFPLDLGRQ